MAGPMSYWRTSSPVLGYMGSLTVFHHRYGISMNELCRLPRFFKRYWYGRINSEHFLYIVKRDSLIDPWCIQEAFNLLERIIDANELVKFDSFPLGLGLTTEMVRYHVEYLQRTNFSLNPYA